MYSLLDLLILLMLGCGLCQLCVCLWFLVVVGSFFGGSFPLAVYLRVSLSPTSCLLLCRCGQVVLEFVLLCVPGFEAFLCSCSVVCSDYLVVFPDMSLFDLG